MQSLEIEDRLVSRRSFSLKKIF